MALKYQDSIQDSVNAIWGAKPVPQITTPAISEITTSPTNPDVITRQGSISPWKQTSSNMRSPITGEQMSLVDDSTIGFSQWYDTANKQAIANIVKSSALANSQYARYSTPIGQLAETKAQVAPLTDDLAGIDAGTKALAQSIDAYTKTTTDLENARLARADALNKISTVAQIGSSIMGGLEMNDYLDEVKATKDQYETQKQIIDTNIANSETLLMERYRENVADLEVMAAAKNVDPTSGALQSLKDQGAIDMGKDFAIARTNADLQKQALDLQYAMSVRQAARQTKNYWQNAAFDTAFSVGKAFIF